MLAPILLINMSAVDRERELIRFDALNLHHQTIECTEIIEELSTIRWNELLGGTVDEIYEKLCQILLSTCERHAPRRRRACSKSEIPRDRNVLMRRRGK